MENINEQSMSLETSPKKQPTLLLILGVILLLLLVGGGGYYLGSQKNIEPLETQPFPTSVPSPTINDSVVSPTPKTVIPITIPSDWKQYTATDSEFVKITMSMPPGYTFRYVSEFRIHNDDSTESWGFSTSIMGEKNNYTGGSRRAWYEDYLASFQTGIQDQYKEKVLKVSEIPINNSSYLAILVEGPGYNDHGVVSGRRTGTHYVYVQNNILHMITPSSNKAYTAEAQIPKYIGIIFASLTSSQTK